MKYAGRLGCQRLVCLEVVDTLMTLCSRKNLLWTPSV